MNSPRMCCCGEQPTSARYLVLCDSSWPHCAEQAGLRRPYAKVPDAGTADEISYWGAGNIPSLNDVVRTSGGIKGACWVFTDTKPGTGYREVIPPSTNDLETMSSCTANLCYRYLIATPCGWEASWESDPLKPHRMIARESTWNSKLPGGLRCPTTSDNWWDNEPIASTYTVTGHLAQDYCVTVEGFFAWSGDEDEDITEQDLGQYDGIPSSANFGAYVGTGEPACEFPQCADLWTFEPCAGSNEFAYKMAAKAEVWEDLLDLPSTPVAGNPVTYAGTWLFKRDADSSDPPAGCCEGQAPCVEFCGKLFPPSANNTGWCLECNPSGSTQPLPICTGCNAVGQIQVLCPDQASYSALDFERAQPNPNTGNACTRLDCSTCQPIDCGGKFVVEGRFKLSISFSKSYDLTDTDVSTGSRTESGSSTFELEYTLPYRAEMEETTTVDDSVCNATPVDWCEGPPWYDAPGRTDDPPIVQEFEGTCEFNLATMSVSGSKRTQQVASFGSGGSNGSGAFFSTGSFRKPTSSKEQHPLGEVNTFPTGTIRIAKRIGVDMDVQATATGTDRVPCFTAVQLPGLRKCPAQCYSNEIDPHECYVSVTGVCSIWPVCSYGGSYFFNGPGESSKGSDSGYETALDMGFAHSYVIDGEQAANFLTCCGDDASTILSGKGVHSTGQCTMTNMFKGAWFANNWANIITSGGAGIGDEPAMPGNYVVGLLPAYCVCEDPADPQLDTWSQNWFSSPNCYEGFQRIPNIDESLCVWATRNPIRPWWCEGYNQNEMQYEFIKSQSGSIGGSIDDSTINFQIQVTCIHELTSVSCS